MLASVWCVDDFRSNSIAIGMSFCLPPSMGISQWQVIPLANARVSENSSQQMSIKKTAEMRPTRECMI